MQGENCLKGNLYVEMEPNTFCGIILRGNFISMGRNGRIIYRGLWRQEIQNFIGGDEIITRGLARGENLTLYFHGKNH